LSPAFISANEPHAFLNMRPRNHLDNLAQAHIFNGMEHRGIEYSVVQSVERGKWNWFAVIDATMTKSGQAKSKPAAVADAEHAIDRAIAPKRVPPRSV